MVGTAKLFIVVGLPGSGKTINAIEELKSMGWEFYDDFFSDANNHKGTVSNAKRLPELINNLDNGSDCVISDIIFCDSTSLMDAIKELEIKCKFVWLRVIFFEKDLQKCEYNVTKRNSIDLKRQLDLINNILGPNYDPQIYGYQSIVLRVWETEMGDFNYHDQLVAFAKI